MDLKFVESRARVHRAPSIYIPWNFSRQSSWTDLRQLSTNLSIRCTRLQEIRSDCWEGRSLQPLEVAKMDTAGELRLDPPCIWKPKPLWSGKQCVSMLLKNLVRLITGPGAAWARKNEAPNQPPCG